VTENNDSSRCPRIVSRNWWASSAVNPRIGCFSRRGGLTRAAAFRTTRFHFMATFRAFLRVSRWCFTVPGDRPASSLAFMNACTY